MAMSGWFPVVLLGVVACIWLAALYQSQKLYDAFVAKYPRQAIEHIPFAFSRTRHPEKLLFFLRRTSIPLLRADASLWKLRQRLKFLLILSLVVPVASFVLLAGYAFFETLAGN
jgi:hypothetical protein